MRTVCKGFLALAFAALPLFMLGCGGGGGGGDGILSGALHLKAKASAGNGAFAASVRSGSAAVRAAAAAKYAARIKRIGYPPMIVTVDISSDRKELTLDKTIDNVPAGKQQVGIEIIASGSPDTSNPILKTYVTAEVAGGQTSTPSEAPINAETTAKALCFDAWTASTSKTIDDFAPPVASITAMAASITNVLGNGDLPYTDDFAFPADVTNGAKTIAQTVSIVDDVPPATEKRLSGSYRYYEYSASPTFRWANISDVTISANTWSSKTIYDPTGEDTGTSYSTTVTETSGALAFANNSSSRGAVSPSGNVFVTHNWQSDDPYIGFGVKLPTNATKALMKGTWRFYGFNETIDAKRVPSAPKIRVETWVFDGSNNVAVSFVGGDLSQQGGTVPYFVTSDGKLTLGDSTIVEASDYYQVCANGEIFVGASPAGFYLGVKQGSGMSTADLAGDFTNAGLGAGRNDGYSASWSGLVTITGNGFGTYTNGMTETGPEGDETFINTVSSAGLMDKDGTYGSLSPSGEVMVSFVLDDISARDINFAVRR
ncbi:MAG TPA: hypothetical protein PLP29_11665 [Candidatus Ozemobacteraceae bacterium]|nr:hypothetical protein [Candidatus Ozemobacteraceae bacterium]